MGIDSKIWYSPRVTRHRPRAPVAYPGEFWDDDAVFRGRMGKLTLLLLALLVWLQYSLWFGKTACMTTRGLTTTSPPSRRLTPN
nr:cell division protein FtsB [Klebsiella pneumoniae]